MPEEIIDHLVEYEEDGFDILGVYPLFPDSTCRFIVFDFDSHEEGVEQADFANVTEEWSEEVDALRLICESNGIILLAERSRSGRGAHVRVFFKKPVSASFTRNFGFSLLDKGSVFINLKSFHYYNCMYPSQDVVSSIGNLIALPLQGRAFKTGNSALIDKNWNAYPDQWDILLSHTKKLSMEDTIRRMKDWQEELSGYGDIPATAVQQNRPKPQRKKDGSVESDTIGKMHTILGNGVYVDVLNLMPHLQNQIRSMAVFDNPVFYKSKRLGYSNYYNFSAVCMGKDEDDCIRIPKGLRSGLIASCREAGIDYEIEDHREKERPIRITLQGDPRVQRDLAANRLPAYNQGVFSVATTFGKTVVYSYPTSERKINTLILIQSRELLRQWVDELNKLLIVDKEPPIYKIKSDREKRRESMVRVLRGSKNTLIGIIDVVVIGSVYSEGKFNDRISSYGMVLVDECRHCGSNALIVAIQKVNARYVYGISATPNRSDNLDKIIYILPGSVRYRYTTKERAIEQGIGHYAYPRYTRVIDIDESRNDTNEVYSLISSNHIRNDMTLEDTRTYMKEGRMPVILTKYKEQAKYLYGHLQVDTDHILIPYGDNSDKENSHVRQQLEKISRNQNLTLMATGWKIGEDFDYPRLDTLMLVAPVLLSGRLEQYLGRLNRDYEGKNEVAVHDHIDSHIRIFGNMYARRLRTYKRVRSQLIANGIFPKQTANAIYNSDNYTDVFEQDLVETGKRIIVSGPKLTLGRIKRSPYLVKARQEAGHGVTVVTLDPQNLSCGSSEFCHGLICEMQRNGIRVIIGEDIAGHFAIIDDELVWYGSMNSLGERNAWDNLMRIKLAQVAAELLEIVTDKERGGVR